MKSRGARREPFEVWQSVADLAMGLMATFALALVLLLVQQKNETKVQTERAEELEAEKRKLEEEKRRLLEEKRRLEADKSALAARTRQLEQDRARFALEVIRILSVTGDVAGRQDRAETLIGALFDESDCLLELTDGGELRRKGTTVADLYESGATVLAPQGQQALASCKANFLRLAFCLGPEGSNEARWKECVQAFNQGDVEALRILRSGVEALVLQGNTDRRPVSSAQPEPIWERRGKPVSLTPLPDAFVGNAALGAERARQALGHLLALVQGHDSEPSDALQVLMARVRVESASFGRYQAGPTDWRAQERCDTPPCPPACADTLDCDAARNLSLRVRWKKEELRRPFVELRTLFCERLLASDGALAAGLKTLEEDPAVRAALVREYPELAALGTEQLIKTLGCTQ
jgi:hypothetical protein